MSKETIQAWRNAVILDWHSSRWCNYACGYCTQKHRRKAKWRGHPAHWADNAPPEKWLAAFDHHFSTYRALLQITGGEVMLDKPNMKTLLAGLNERDYIKRIKIDTNATWRVAPYEGLLEKVVIMATYHPTQTTREAFLQSVKEYHAHGIPFAFVNFVMADGTADEFKAIHEALAPLGIVVQPNPLWYKPLFKYHPPERAILEEYLPRQDLLFRSMMVNPQGKPCLFPAIAYEIFPSGELRIACQHNSSNKSFPAAKGNLFQDTIPKAEFKYRRCPVGHCNCTHKYPFLKEIDRYQTFEIPAVLNGHMLKAMLNAYYEEGRKWWNAQAIDLPSMEPVYVTRRS